MILNQKGAILSPTKKRFSLRKFSLRKKKKRFSIRKTDSGKSDSQPEMRDLQSDKKAILSQKGAICSPIKKKAITSQKGVFKRLSEKNRKQR